MRVLYVNHTAVVSGAERSLLSLVASLPRDVEAVVACPRGELQHRARAAGVQVRVIAGTAGSLKLHPIHTSRAVLELGRSALAVRRAAAETGAHILHANTIRAGLIAAVAGRLGAPPVVVHVRDRLPAGRVPSLSLRLIASGARVVIANSTFTATQFGPHAGNVQVIPNAVDAERFDPAAVDGHEVRRGLGLDPVDVVLAVIGQLTPWKGQDTAIKVVGRLMPRHPSLKLLVIGSAKFTAAATRHDNRSYEAGLRRLVAELGLEHRVRFLGEREDIPDLLAATNLLLAPSWEEPFGRSIVEALAMEVPVIATEAGGPAEIVRPGLDGVLLPPLELRRWIEETDALIEDSARRVEMGARGRAQVLARFTVDRHVAEILRAYARVVGD